MPVEVHEVDDDISVVRMARIAKRNAIDLPFVADLHAALVSAKGSVVILSSADPTCFCAGADRSIPADERAVVSDRLYETYQEMVDHPATIVAAVGGYAVGGGAQLALASDLRVGNATSEFRFVGVGHGLAVGAWALPGIVGRGRAMELTMTMRPVLADEALRIGLLNAVAPDAEAEALSMARGLAAHDRGARARLKAVSLSSQNTRDALARERDENRRGWSGTLDL